MGLVDARFLELANESLRRIRDAVDEPKHFGIGKPHSQLEWRTFSDVVS